MKRVIARWDGNVFVDVGANIGDYTLLTWRRYYRNVAFEPNAQAFKKLQSRIGWRQRFHYFQLHNSAISDVELAQAKLYGDNRLTCDTLEQDFKYRPPSQPNIDMTAHGGSYSIVRSRTLDSYDFAMGETDFKIDVEGSEFRVLDGGKKALANAGRIVVELHDRNRGVELEERLLDLGFRVGWIDADHVQGTHLMD